MVNILTHGCLLVKHAVFSSLHISVLPKTIDLQVKIQRLTIICWKSHALFIQLMVCKLNPRIDFALSRQLIFFKRSIKLSLVQKLAINLFISNGSWKNIAHQLERVLNKTIRWYDKKRFFSKFKHSPVILNLRLCSYASFLSTVLWYLKVV